MTVHGLIVALFLLLFAGFDREATLSRETPETLTRNPVAVDNDWPFKSSPDLAVITLDRIMIDSNPILYVTHDEDDGGWQFLDGGDVAEENAMVVALREIVAHDPTIKQLADLPLGWYAERDSVDQPWQRHAAGN